MRKSRDDETKQIPTGSIPFRKNIVIYDGAREMILPDSPENVVYYDSRKAPSLGLLSCQLNPNTGSGAFSMFIYIPAYQH